MLPMQTTSTLVGMSGADTGNNSGVPRCPFDRIYDLAIIVTAVPDELEKAGEGHVHPPQKWSVSSAAVHEVCGHFAAQFEASLDDESRQPSDAIHGSGFRG